MIKGLEHVGTDHKCTVCSCDFTDDEGGIQGHFGMLPVALGLGAGGEWRSPMAITVIGGLITSTLLTLVVVPVAYNILESRHRRPLKTEEEIEV